MHEQLLIESPELFTGLGFLKEPFQKAPVPLGVFIQAGTNLRHFGKNLIGPAHGKYACRTRADFEKTDELFFCRKVWILQ